MEKLTRELLLRLGEDPTREGLERTPERVAESWRYLTCGYRQTIEEVINGAIFTQDYNEMILCKDIELFSMCEHHLLPFFGRVHVAYIPDGKIIGISKIPRIVDMFARRLQIQERLTQQVAQTLMRELEPIGVGVIIEAKHLCMVMRGVEKQHSEMVTSAMLGEFHDSAETRAEFLKLVEKRN
ncbi:MAG: GTP cyclohydrolase I FolE [Candidatus Delongbacteria bacterium]|nr:GTP cyclohydrolase I FolE [Candidatus Delongbacteria bacterium]